MLKSAGILAYRIKKDIEVFLVHPGGPFWSKKDLGAWSIPKGELNDGDDILGAAKREFHEETSQEIDGDFIAMKPVRQNAGKMVYAFAVEADLKDGPLQSNYFEMEWPPKSGKMQSFPEVDRAAWFSLDEAREKINKGQLALLDELKNLLDK